MIRKSLIALSAAAAMAVALAPAAEAKTRINVGIGFGGFGGGVYIGGGYGCHKVVVKHSHWNKWHTKKITYFTKERVCY